jgi:hypothetical protein
VGEKPAAGRGLTLQLPHEDHNTISFDLGSVTATTDAQGHFAFPQVPPGKCIIVRLVYQPPNVLVHQVLPDGEVEIRPGEITSVTLRGTGYTVKAHPRLPDGITPGKGWRWSATVYGMPPTALQATVGDPVALARFKDSAEGREYARNVRRFAGSIGSDYTITVEDVLPGTYKLAAAVFPDGMERSSSCLSGGATVTVPTDPPTGELDVGEVVLKRQDAVEKP